MPAPDPPDSTTRAVELPYNLRAILRTRDELAEVLRFEFEGRTVSGRRFDRFLRVVRQGLPLADVDMDVLADSIRAEAGRVLDAETLVALAHRLAGNLARLASCRPVPPWHVQRFPEWVPVQVLGCARARGGKGQMGALFRFKVMAGTPCPRVVLQWWSNRRCLYHARDFGLAVGRARGKTPRLPYEAPEQFATLRLAALIDPALSRAEPAFAEVKFPAGRSIAGWNRTQLRRRLRLGFACPEGYPDDFPCHRCHRGYRSCPAGTHRDDYVERPCPLCGLPDAVWDPESPFEGCVDCATYKAYHPHKDPPRRAAEKHEDGKEAE